jgi:hypothetical protein
MRSACLRFLLCCLGLCLVVPAASSAPKPPEPAAHYECLWWSEAQMEGLNPNHPPPKETVVKIAKWEYSDPVAVPHPDSVTLVARIPAGLGGPLSVRVKWKRQRWGVAQKLERISVAEEADGERQLSAEIPVGKEIDHLRPRLLRSEILAGGRVIKTLDLPIELGD